MFTAIVVVSLRSAQQYLRQNKGARTKLLHAVNLAHKLERTLHIIEFDCL